VVSHVPHHKGAGAQHPRSFWGLLSYACMVWHRVTEFWNVILVANHVVACRAVTAANAHIEDASYMYRSIMYRFIYSQIDVVKLKHRHRARASEFYTRPSLPVE